MDEEGNSQTEGTRKERIDEQTVISPKRLFGL
jgi:hypothetical protein